MTRRRLGARIVGLVVVTVAGMLVTHVYAQDQAAADPVRSAHEEHLQQLWADARTNESLLSTLEALRGADENARHSEAAVRLGIVGEPESTSIEADRYEASLNEVLLRKGDAIRDLSRGHSERGRAVGFIGLEAPHEAFLPLLHVLASSTTERDYVRVSAVQSISRIPHSQVVEELIEYLNDPVLGRAAWEQLGMICQWPVPFRDADRSGMRAEYERWWAQHQQAVVYDRKRTLREQ